MGIASSYGSSIMSRKGAEFWWNLKTEAKVIIPKEVSYYETR